MTASGVAVVAGLVVAWCLLSARLQRVGITAPMAFVAAGLIAGGAFEVQVGSGSLKFLAEVTLVLLLFADASRIDVSSLHHDVGPPVRLLGIGLPLTIVAGTAIAIALFSGIGAWPAVLVAACLAPTDAGLGAGIVTDPRVPSRVRRVLNVESGLNDGIVAPLVALAIAIVAEEASHQSTFIAEALREIGFGAAVGLAIGLGAGWLLATATRRKWSAAGADQLAVAAVAVGAYAVALWVHGNGFVAAFLAGLAFAPFRESLDPTSVDLTENAGQLASTVVWFAFGAVMLRPALGAISWPVVVYALLSLTLVRMIPVAIALVGAQLDRSTTLFVGWFGPRGLASVIFALLAFDDLDAAAGPLLAVVSITVALSVVAHGFSAGPLIGRYREHIASKPATHPVHRDVDVPRARRTLGSRRSVDADAPVGEAPT